jgi:hypothetical protein
MKNWIIPILLCFSFPYISFSSGIAIVDGSKGIYFKTIEISTIVNVNTQIATITCTQSFKNTTGKDTRFKFAYPLKKM